MAKLTSASSYIEEYWEGVKDQYDISFEEFKKICLHPFKFIKECMASGELKNIRMKYLGVFQVSGSRVKYSKKSLDANFEKGVISAERYFRRLQILNNYEES